MGETRDWLEEHGCAGRVLCGKTGTFVISLCADCPRMICRSAQKGSTECDECRAECPDWTDEDNDHGDGDTG